MEIRAKKKAYATIEGSDQSVYRGRHFTVDTDAEARMTWALDHTHLSVLLHATDQKKIYVVLEMIFSWKPNLSCTF